jgi:hypothetical protein
MDPLTIIILSITFLLSIWIAYKLGIYKKHLEWQENLVKIRADVAEKQRVGIKGDPIDYLVFEGLDERDIKAVHFVEIKEGSSKLSKHQKQIKSLIDDLDSTKVTFDEFRFDSESFK